MGDSQRTLLEPFFSKSACKVALWNLKYTILSLSLSHSLSPSLPLSYRAHRVRLTSSILMAEVGEPPYVPQAHAEAHLSQYILQLAVPRRAVVCIPRRRHAPGGPLHSQVQELRLRPTLSHPSALLIARQWRLLHLDKGNEEQVSQ